MGDHLNVPCSCNGVVLDECVNVDNHMLERQSSKYGSRFKHTKEAMNGKESVICTNNSYFDGVVNANLTKQIVIGIDDGTIVNEILKPTVPMKNLFIGNASIRNSNIILSNIWVLFVNCSFYNVNIKDLANVGPVGRIHVTIFNSLFQCHDTKKQYPGDRHGFTFQDALVVEIFLSKTTVRNCKFNISSREILLIITDSLLYVTSFEIIATSQVDFRVPSNILISGTKILSEKHILSQRKLSFLLQNPFIIIDNCSFNRVSVEINQPNVPFQQVLNIVKITHSTFVNASKNGNGGAVSISSHVKNSTVELVRDKFIGNEAQSLSSLIPGKGGAVFIKGSSLFLNIDSCLFDRNSAIDKGSSLYASEGVGIEIINSTFLVNVTYPYNAHPIVSSFGKISKLVAIFIIVHELSHLYKSDLKVFSMEQSVSDLIFSVQCPLWHRHMMQYHVEAFDSLRQQKNLSATVMKNLVYECRVCPEDYYVVSHQTNLIKYSRNYSAQQMPDCIECPYGAICSGNNIIPRSNYWGYFKKNKLVFLQCPAGYCCFNSKSTKCEKYYSCAGNRTGILCGACREGFSVSILTGECLPNSKCGRDQWFWLLAILAMLSYAFWYTFKDDFIFLFFHLFDGVKFLYSLMLRCRKRQKKGIHSVKFRHSSIQMLWMLQ